ncbi:type II toxin-antitoxin system RelE/ParE family toxin [Neorhizobium galegae]|uniref:type II toxin-antitoxin system RelE/ParE family toxin n=1 Tax=Neorhizobium galegae TaxID=399 RepID=UPI001F1C22B6|nr:type II toxin-antitoxin system RelE/ParE family toxin [Neorhizobium galegae]UIK06710.1 type II toxin-antitoxin system RelE/ParE family toxin [Neorhizobium galegae]
MIEIQETEIYSTWFARLRDERAKARINARIYRLSLGNPGDVKPVGSGVSEMRVDYGPGFRIYFIRRGQAFVVLLCGGDKSSQTEDIVSAKKLAAGLEGRK